MIKLDIKKAYDNVEWGFIEEMMGALQLPAQYTALVMTCNTTLAFSFMINGTSHGFFKSTRGLRQGDPISALLFVFCFEYISRILGTISKHKDFKYHPRCRGLKLTQLSYADDLILCCKGEVQPVKMIMRGFNAFSKCTGLQASPQKNICILLWNERGRNSRSDELDWV